MLGTDEQRATLAATQARGTLGCFAFTEKGCGVLSGAGCETTATFDQARDEFVFASPTPSSAKNWISQGLYAEDAVILANLIVKGDDKGPHLFWGQIADGHGCGDADPPPPRAGARVTSCPQKTAMRGLDNAEIAFDGFRLPRSSLLGRFCALDRDGSYVAARIFRGDGSRRRRG